VSIYYKIGTGRSKMGVVKIDGFNNRYRMWLSGGKKEIVVDVGEFTPDSRGQDGILIRFSENEFEPWHHLKYTDLLLLAQLATEARKDCEEHVWIDIRNEVITSGEMCFGCGRVRAGNETTD
jgi:hypothetical protein